MRRESATKSAQLLERLRHLQASRRKLASSLAKQLNKISRASLKLEMGLPPGAKLHRFEGSGTSGKLVILKPLWLAINALPEEDVENLATVYRGSPYRREYFILHVNFGPITGRKFIIKAEPSRGPYKTIAYALSVPGGHVFGSIAAIGTNVDEVHWDETPFESVFHTLRVETKVP